MASNVVNRSTHRIALGALLRAAMVGTGKPTQKVYDEPVASFPEANAVVLESDGSGRSIIDIADGTSATLSVNVHLFVVWRPGAEDILDMMEKQVADVIFDNKQTATWELDYPEQTEPEIFQAENSYRHEVITVKIRVDD